MSISVGCKRSIIPAMALVWVLAAYGCQAPQRDPAEVVRGAGASFPAPLYQRWATGYRKIGGVAIRYEPTGSGAGLDAIRQATVDFAGTEKPLSPQALRAARLLQFPVVGGGVVPVINIRGIAPGALRLTGEVLARIYLGDIRRWNDPAIVRLNPALNLPNANITVVHRSDASGSSLLWSSYMARRSAQWAARVGAALLPAWPVGVGGAGNEGVAAYVEHTRFALGYVEYAYARQHRLSDVAVRNHDGVFVRGSLDTFRAALQSGGGEGGLINGRSLDSDLPGATTWPITNVSFVLVSADLDCGTAGVRVLKFFHWAMSTAESLAPSLDYIPLSPAVLDGLMPRCG